MSSSQPTDDIVPDSSRTAINDIEQRLAAADSFDFTGRIEADGCSRMNFTENAFLAAEALTVEVAERTVDHRQRPSPSRSTIVTTEDGAVRPGHTAATAALPSSALSRLEQLNGELLIEMQAREQDLECAVCDKPGLKRRLLSSSHRWTSCSDQRTLTAVWEPSHEFR
jgi:hypothetical protein